MEKVLEYIRRNRMINTGDKIVVGVSGGPDSVCLLFLLNKYRQNLGITLSVVHMEHGIRGKESLDDASFVDNLCRAWEIPFFLCRKDVPRLAAKWKCSEEEAARRVRYEAFEEIREKLGADRIAVAHNQDDQAETVLFHLVRGSGALGLSGMRPVRGRIIRPLLCLSREEIEEILRREGIGYRLDSTNREAIYTRNRIRLNILPLLREELNPKAAVHMAEAAERLAAMEDYLFEEAVREAGRITERREGSLYLRRRELAEEKEILQNYILRYCLGQIMEECPGEEGHRMEGEAGDPRGCLHNISAVHIEDLKRLALNQSGRRIDLPCGVWGRTEGEYLILSRRPKRRPEKQHRSGTSESRTGKAYASGPDESSAGKAYASSPDESSARKAYAWGPDEFCAGEAYASGPGESAVGESYVSTSETSPACVPLPSNGEVRYGKYRILTAIVPYKNEIIPEKMYTKWFDYDTIKNTVQLRPRSGGDYLTVTAEGGRKTLKRYLIDEKVPAGERDQLCLLADGSHILWVVGLRISEAYKITKKTQWVLKVQVMEE